MTFSELTRQTNNGLILFVLHKADQVSKARDLPHNYFLLEFVSLCGGLYTWSSSIESEAIEV